MSKIHLNPAHKGALHRALGIASGKPIPEAREEAAKHSPDPAVRKQANFALNFRHPKKR